MAPNGIVKAQVDLRDGFQFISTTTPPAIGSDGTIYVGAISGTSPCLLATDSSGALKWKFDEMSASIYSPPTLGTNGIVYFGCDDKKLYAVAGSVGPGSAPWPMYRGNARHTGALCRRLGSITPRSA